jgi:lysyl-tRNA synthetase class I
MYLLCVTKPKDMTTLNNTIENTITWYLKINPSSINLMLTNAKEFLLEALSAEQKYLSEFVVDENKMNAFVEYIAPKVYNGINK